ncbi:NucA/NucB deoxyribonuclease domain-containing protein [Paenibacillus sp. CC-CFT742]|uniref:NucA/NucB deoxyribonuclease domain-containing protein n=1 Tax=Paenibacillus illinoisensis TaxID=59845 RepID=UPI002576E30F|nr:NucA/NucB deoxyribonuclease domain-containing protein [Paenibacillus sp. CC-CFT742]WJH28414.1 NucA/NucB deoxyribonuclease domain-containing protein [Paenibacillus sp. CC-CFT742]
MKRKRTRKKKNKGWSNLKKSFITLVTLVVLAVFAWFEGELPLDLPSPFKGSSQGVDHTITFPSDRYPETAKHIKDAIKAGHSDVCTIDREGAEANRDLSLKGVPVKKGKDRDEWPMAMCAEGGSNADIEYITPKDNRGAGSWVGNQLSTYPDGTRVKFVVK